MYPASRMFSSASSYDNILLLGVYRHWKVGQGTLGLLRLPKTICHTGTLRLNRIEVWEGKGNDKQRIRGNVRGLFLSPFINLHLLSNWILEDQLHSGTGMLITQVQSQ